MTLCHRINYNKRGLTKLLGAVAVGRGKATGDPQ